MHAVFSVKSACVVLLCCYYPGQVNLIGLLAVENLVMPRIHWVNLERYCAVHVMHRVPADLVQELKKLIAFVFADAEFVAVAVSYSADVGVLVLADSDAEAMGQH